MGEFLIGRPAHQLLWDRDGKLKCKTTTSLALDGRIVTSRARVGALVRPRRVGTPSSGSRMCKVNGRFQAQIFQLLTFPGNSSRLLHSPTTILTILCYPW